MESINCSVCDENYNKKNRKKIICCSCEYQQCQECVKRYLILLSQIEPKCMNCNVEWKINFIKNNLPKSFLDKEYKQHQKQIIFEKEKQHFPELMNEIYEEKERDRLFDESDKINEQIIEQSKIKRKLKEQIKQIKQNKNWPKTECPQCHGQDARQFTWKKIYCIRCQEIPLEEGKNIEKVNQLEKKISQFEEQVSELNDKDDKIQRKINKLGNKKKKQVYYIHCPINGCNGLVNSEKNHCGICNTKVCKKCNEAVQQRHECKQENIESAKKIRSQCKQCPTCQTQIYRIEGCNDMFCVQCKTSFNWATGQKMQRTTNPHYYEYIRQNNIQDIDEDAENCQNDLINIRVLIRFLDSKRQGLVTEVTDKYITRTVTTELPISGSTHKKITDLHQKVNHIEQVEIRKLEENNNNSRQKIRDLCKQYLNNVLNEDDLKDKLQKMRKQQEKKRSMQQILEAYIEVSKKEINEIPQQKNVQNIIKKVEIIENFRKYIQEQIEQTKKDYDSKMTINI